MPSFLGAGEADVLTRADGYFRNRGAGAQKGTKGRAA